MDGIKTISNDALIEDLKKMVADERKLLTTILHHLKEVEERRLYLERGYSSLFAFITEELGYSESAAQRRIQAMRLMRDVPKVEEKIESGKLSLSVASQVQSFIRSEEKRNDKRVMSTPEKLEVIEKLEGTSIRVCERKLAEISPETKVPKEKERPISDEKTFIQFIADEELMDGIERLKWLTSHRNGERRLDELFRMLVELGLEKWDPERREARREKRKTKASDKSLPAPAVDKVTPARCDTKLHRRRSIPAPVRDEVWQRDDGRCQYKDPETGKRCGSRHAVQIDHIVPVARGGTDEASNLRLLCRQHNAFAAKKVFGDRLIDSKIRGQLSFIKQSSRYPQRGNAAECPPGIACGSAAGGRASFQHNWARRRA